MSSPRPVQERGSGVRGTNTEDRGTTVGRPTNTDRPINSSDRGIEGRGSSNPGTSFPSAPTEQLLPVETAASASPAIGATAIPPGLKAVADALRAIAKTLGVESLLRLVEEELLRTTSRLLIANAIESATKRFSATKEIGNHVHIKIQNQYLDWYVSSRDIAIEHWDPSAGLVKQIVRGPSTDGKERPLIVMAGSRFDPTRFWQTLHSAMTGAKFKPNSYLRADLVDSRMGSKVPPSVQIKPAFIWEIKPTKSARAGVIQEANYRIMFSLVRHINHLPFPKAQQLIPELHSGGFLTKDLSLSEGIAAILNPINVSKQAREPAVAIPFQLGILPGLILYVTIRSYLRDYFLILIPVLVDVIKELEKLNNKIRQNLKEVFEEVIVFARELLDAIKEVLDPLVQFVSVLLLVALLIFMFMLLRGGPLPSLLSVPPSSPSGPPRRSIYDHYAMCLPKTLRNLNIVSGFRQREAFSITLESKNPQRQQASTSFISGPIGIHGLPKDTVADFVSFFFEIVDDLTKPPANRIKQNVSGSAPRVA